MGKKQKKGMESRSKKSRDTKELFETAYGHHMKGNTALAEDLYLRIIRMEPRHSNALNLLGTICLERGEHDKALDLIMKAVKAYPMGAMFHNNLGNVFRKMGLSKDAEKAYREALRVDPACVAANNNLGTVLYEQGDMAKAIDHYETACRNDAGFSPAYYNLGRVFCEQGRIDTAIWAYRQALKIDPDFHEASSNLLYTLHFSDALTPGLIFEAHREWAKTFAERYYPKDPVYENMRDIGKKLRIGYVSPDFKAHSVAFFLEDVIVAHNRERVEVFCYSCSDKKDEYTFRFQEISDAWRDISALSDEEACRMIRDDRIDILVDLAGHTRNSRILVFAWKPAPVQVTWLGYPDTTGLETMGYRITDLVADPPGEADALASEKLVRLPGGFHCYRPSGESFPIKPLPCLATGAVTFGSFNNNAKISESVISAWSRILKGAPGSRLKLKSRSFADFGTRKHILERFGHYGIPSERIWFEGYKVSLKEHFLLYNTVDIALDTFPYNGTTTTCEALFMGVPVITLKGDAHVSRVGASLLHHSGLDGFIASTVDEYVEKAVALSNNVEMLSSLRKVLRDKIGSSTLMNPGSFAEKLENAFRDMWKEWVARETTGTVSAAGSSLNDETGVKDFFLSNIALVRERHPRIEDLLDGKHPFPLKTALLPGGLPNFYIKRGSEDFAAVYTGKTSEDIAPFSERLRNIKGKVVCVMGCGLFIHARPILEMAGDRNLVVFFEAYPSIFKTALETMDLKGVLDHPHARFAIGEMNDPYDLIHSEEDTLYTSGGGEFIEFGPLCALAPEWYRERRAVFEKYLTRRRVSMKTAAFAGRRFIENSFGNLLGLSESMPLNALKDSMAGIPAVIVASGPSLSKNIGELKKAGDRAWIIAVDSALSPLMENGIRPHAVVSVDYNEFTYEKLAPYAGELHETDLVFIPSVTSKILNGIRFRNRFYSFPETGLKEIFNRLLRSGGDALEDVHAVIHLALAAALTAGCGPVVFTGLDLAYSGKKDHAEGTILHWNGGQSSSDSVIMVEGVEGNMVESTSGFIAVKEICERMIAVNPGHVFIDATEGGAKIAGTRILGLKETLESFHPQNPDRFILSCNGAKPPGLRAAVEEIPLLIKESGQLLGQIKNYENELEKVERYLAPRKSQPPDPAALPQAVKKAAVSMDRINGTLDGSVLLSSLTCIFSEYYEEYLDAEMDVAAAPSSPGRRFAAALRQQAFVQRIRKKALQFLMDLAAKTLAFIEKTENAFKTGGLPFQHIAECLDTLIDRQYLVKVEELLSKTVNGPGKQFYEGVIQIIRGDIDKGLAVFESAAGMDGDLIPRIRAFKDKMIEAWLSADGPDTFRRMCLGYALRLEPSNEKVSSVNRERLSHRIMNALGHGDYDTAFYEIESEHRSRPISEPDLSSVFALLLFKRGRISEGLAFLKQSIDGEWESSFRSVLLQTHFHSVLGVDCFSPDLPWVENLVESSRRETWAKRALQELFALNVRSIPGKILKRSVSGHEMVETERMLDEWAFIEEMIPDWAQLKAWALLYRGDPDAAENLLRRAMDVEKMTIPMTGNKGFLIYLSAVFALYNGDMERGTAILHDLLESSENTFYYFRFTAWLLFFRSGDVKRAEKILSGICDEKGNLPWIARICEDYRNGLLTENMDEYRDVNFLSWYFFVMGKYCLETGDKTFGTDCLRASVNHDPSILLKKDRVLIADCVLEKWHEDCSTIESFIESGEFVKAEAVCQEWEATRSAIRDYHPVRAIIREKIEGLSGALEYLDSLPAGESDDPYVLFYLSKLLFVHGRRDQALHALTRAVELDPGAAEFWEEIGDVLFGEGQHNQAVNAYERCISALPDRLDVIRKIGDVYLAMGKKDPALMAYRAVLRADRNNELALRRLQEIEGEG